MNDKYISKKKLFDLLLKKATGFYFNEIQYEYQKTQKGIENTENLADNTQNIDFFDIIDTKSSNSTSTDDTIKSDNLNESADYILSKKKVTTHFNPPDMQAIKMLFDLVKDDTKSDDIKNLSNEELIKLKNKLIEELSNEDNIS